jgi:2'-5' RNA ligase
MEHDRTRLRKGGAVAVAVSGDAAEYVDGFRKRYDPHVTHIMPHVTLAVAPELDVCDWIPARPRIQEALAQIPSFTIRVAELGTFMDDLVLWLQPTAPHGELLTLRLVILGSFPDVAFDRVDDYVPHISIGFFTGREALLEAQGTVRRELMPFSFRAGFISYLQADEGNIWRCVDTVDLGGLSTGSPAPEPERPDAFRRTVIKEEP